jgi:ribosome-binding protein aMBF1 (putative translation factor)
VAAGDSARVHWQRKGRVPVNGAAVQKAREAKGWDRTKLAAELGWCEKTLARYETGEREPTKATVRRMTELLDVPLATLLMPLEARRPG